MSGAVHSELGSGRVIPHQTEISGWEGEKGKERRLVLDSGEGVRSLDGAELSKSRAEIQPED